MHQHDQELRIAVCDDDFADRAALREMLAAYLDENDMAAEIDEFETGEAFFECRS